MQAKQQQEPDGEIADFYYRLRNLIKSGQKESAERFFDNNKLIGVWEPLLHFTMTRRNCEVTKAVLKRVISYCRFTLEEVRVKVSKLLQDITYEFSTRVIVYVNSNEFELEFNRLNKVAETVHSLLKNRTGKGVVNLKHEHFNN